LFFNSDLNVSQAAERVRAELPPLPEVLQVLEFVSRSNRGIPS
ncbi:MAG: acyl-[acyl-carrier-protein]--UDP-N-acetylglucosamine O-acyltransferase, partial [Gemmatimonadales bacterium]|nr:acyl-[acyl-carrier-protein]--UDP-N-acetylglucosamine O-acyltransferase [Gemmatimonadales bacterium]